MAASQIAVTPGAGAALSTETEPSGGKHRQVIVIGDPGTFNEARVSAEGGLWVVPRGGVRNTVTWTYQGITPATTEALVAPTSRSVNSATPVTTQHQVTTGYTLRLQMIVVTIVMTLTTVTTTRITLRSAAGAAVALTSPTQLSWRVGPWSVGTQAAGYTMQPQSLVIPDGLEFVAGTGLGLSMIASATTSHTVDVSMIGYEYPNTPT